MDLSMVVIYIVLLAMGYKVINNTAFNDVVNKDPVLSKMVPKHENKKEATKDQIQKIINLNIHGITTILQNFLRAERCALLDAHIMPIMARHHQGCPTVRFRGIQGGIRLDEFTHALVVVELTRHHQCSALIQVCGIHPRIRTEQWRLSSRMEPSHVHAAYAWMEASYRTKRRLHLSNQENVRSTTFLRRLTRR